jgi:glutamine synthetase
MFRDQSPSGSKPAEAEAFLNKHPQVEAIDLILIDANGIARGKIIRRHELPGLYRSGRHLPISILGLDICGEDVPETGLIWEQGDRDLCAWPVPGSLVPLHGTSPLRGEVFVSLYELDGSPMACDPRHALARQVTLLAGRGFKAAAAFELEFFLFRAGRDTHGHPLAASTIGQSDRATHTGVYEVDQLIAFEPVFTDIYQSAELAGIPAETVISEYAPGQFELTLTYRDCVLQAAQDVIRLKRIVRRAAQRHGLEACFMAKPLADYAGSGMHMHVSLLDEAGKNILTESREGQWHPNLRHAIGGLQETMAEGMIVFAPHANSWRRFTSELYAPVAPTWGANNRSVALRVPLSEPAARRIEHRTSGVDANPYLVGTVVLAGISKGLEEKIEPTAETVGNGYAAEQIDKPRDAAHARPRLPADWREAIEKGRNSDFLKTALGAALHKSFLAIKSAEYARVARTVTDVELALYYHNV